MSSVDDIVPGARKQLAEAKSTGTTALASRSVSPTYRRSSTKRFIGADIIALPAPHDDKHLVASDAHLPLDVAD
jgi:hypothetical protein